MHWFWRSPNLRARRPERRRPATATPPRDGAQVRAAPASSEQYLDPAVAGRRLRPPSTEKSSEGSTTRRIRQAQREPPALLHTALPSWGASRGGEAVTWAAPLRSFAQCADICCWPPAPPQRVPSTGHRCARLHTPFGYGARVSAPPPSHTARLGLQRRLKRVLRRARYIIYQTLCESPFARQPPRRPRLPARSARCSLPTQRAGGGPTLHALVENLIFKESPKSLTDLRAGESVAPSSAATRVASRRRHAHRLPRQPPGCLNASAFE